MAGFQQDIGNIEARESQSQLAVDTSSQQEAAAVATLVTGGAQLADVAIKSSFASDLAGIKDDSSIFANMQKNARTDLLDAMAEGILTTDDANRVDSLNNRFRAIARGEDGKKLSSGAASAMRNSTLRQAISDFPWLASDFRSIASNQPSNRITAETPNATDKALEKLQAEAVMFGIPLSQVIKQNKKAKQIEIDAADFNVAKQQGLVQFQQLDKHVNDVARLESTALRAEMFAAKQADPKSLDAPEWGERVNALKSKLRVFAKDKSAGILLGKPERDSLERNIEVELAFAEGFLKSNDKIAYIERQQKLMQANSDELLFDSNPALFNCQLHQGADYCAKLNYDVWPKFLGDFRKHNGLSTIRGIANKGDTEAIQFLQMFEFNSGAWTNGMMDKLRKGTEPGTTYEQFLLNGLSGSVLATRAADGDNSVNPLKVQATSRLADKEIEHFLRPDVMLASSDNKAVREELDNSMVFKTDASMARLGTALLEVRGNAAVVFDESTSTLVVKDERGKILHKAGGPEAQGAGAEVGAMVNYLNNVVAVRKSWMLYPSEGRRAWVDNLVSGIKERKRAASLPVENADGGLITRGKINRDETAKSVAGKGEQAPEALITIEDGFGGWVNISTIIDGKQVSESEAINAPEMARTERREEFLDP